METTDPKAKPNYDQYLSGCLVAMMKYAFPMMENIPTNDNDILLVIDMQHDFASLNPKGKLYVAEGSEIQGAVTQLIGHDRFEHVFASKDFHPPDHVSFGTFPPHCVQVHWKQEFTPNEVKGYFDESGSKPRPAYPTSIVTPMPFGRGGGRGGGGNTIVSTPGGGPPYINWGSYSRGAKFEPYVLDALNAKRSAGGSVRVFFKGFNKHHDSFGAIQYNDGGVALANRRTNDGALFPLQMHECLNTFTGAFDFGLGPDLDADPQPSDKTMELTHNLENCKHPSGFESMKDAIGKTLNPQAGAPPTNIFLCGLTMDYCVLDTALNVKAAFGYRVAVYIVVDATRPVFIAPPGPGYLLPPDRFAAMCKEGGVGLVKCGVPRTALPQPTSGGDPFRWRDAWTAGALVMAATAAAALSTLTPGPN